MAEINTDLVDWFKADELPDYTTLGHRIIFVDGVNANQIATGRTNDARIMGAYPHYQDLVLTALTGSTLSAGTWWYGVRWRVTDNGGRKIRSALTLQSVVVTGTKKVRLTISPYEFQPGASANWTVVAEIYRSRDGAASLLYLVDAAAITGVGGTYTDTTVDSSLDESDTYDVSVPDTNQFMPPARCIRAWRQRLVLGGYTKYRRGLADVVADGSSNPKKHVYLTGVGNVRKVDRYASVWIAGHGRVYQIADVDVFLERAWVLDEAVPDYFANQQCMLYRDDAVYVGNPLPGNIEGYPAMDKVIYQNGANNPLRGIAVAGGYCYLLHQNSIYTLEGSTGAWGARLLAAGLGCVGHKTIADGHSDTVYAYAGERGVIAIKGQQVTRISAPIDDLIRTSVDHTFDKFAHGVFDPVHQMYHLWLYELGVIGVAGVRVASLMLSFDARNGEWYAGNLSASLSAVVKRQGRLVAVVLVPGRYGVLTLDTYQDFFAYSGTLAGGSEFTSTTFRLATTPFPTDDNGVAGAPVYLFDSDGVLLERQIVKGNTSSRITTWGEWTTTPDATMTYRIGDIQYSAEFDDLAMRPMRKRKVFKHVGVMVDADSAENEMTVEAIPKRADSGLTTSTKTQDMNGVDYIEMGRNLTIRGRSVKVKLSGLTRREVVVRGIDVDADEASDGR